MLDSSPTLRGLPVTRDQVLRAIREFDLETHERDWLSYKSQLYVLVFEDKPYPPKRTLSLATGLPVRSFHGGREANGVLRALGFQVVPKAEFTRSDSGDFKRFLLSGPRFDGLEIERSPEPERVVRFDDITVQGQHTS